MCIPRILQLHNLMQEIIRNDNEMSAAVNCIFLFDSMCVCVGEVHLCAIIACLAIYRSDLVWNFTQKWPRSSFFKVWPFIVLLYGCPYRGVYIFIIVPIDTTKLFVA